jgi:alkanesulfonate monooxygenase SsuD/methylene tetrahydromethanopterin reductase-like flavin-dependent oxidoreductase (luciferase family)
MVPDGNLAQVHQAQQQVTVAQVRHGILADRLGFDSFYLTEHHFQVEGAEHSPNPILTGVAIASRTKRIRIGQATNILPQWEPIRLAEQAAMLDVISGGRLDFGIGRGYQPRESEVLGGAFGGTTQDQERNRAIFQESFELILKAWTEPSFSHHGEFFTIPPTYTKWNHAQSRAYFGEQNVGRTLDDVFKLGEADDYGVGANPVERTTTILKELSVFPQPLQKPYPPLFMPIFSKRSADWAAEHGVNCYGLVAPASQITALMERYHEKAELYGWRDRLGDGEPWKPGWDARRRRGIAYVRGIHCTDIAGPESGQRYYEGHSRQWGYYGPFGFNQALTDVGEPKLAIDATVTGEFLNEKNVIVVGSRDEIIERLCKEHVSMGTEDTHLLTWFECSGFESSEIEEQMQFFAEEIAPVLRREFGGAVELEESTVDLDVGSFSAA